MTNHKHKISIVYATVGNDSLFKILNQMRMSRFRDDILNIISLPPNAVEFKAKLEDYFSKDDGLLKHKILCSPIKGQVAQRAYAIRSAESKIIIQMDDDLLISPEVVDQLVIDIEHLGPGYAVGPKICPYSSFNSFGPIKKILYKYIYNNKESNLNGGGILRFGISLYPSSFNDKFTPVEWLPGGCVCYHRCDALYDNYYPYSGKAYYEDVIASILRTKLNIIHLINGEEITIEQPHAFDSISQLFSNIKARNYVNTLLDERYIINIANIIDFLHFVCRRYLKF